MKTHSILFSLCIILTTASCVRTRGNQNVNDIGRFLNLQKGVSTKADIYDAFGQPHDVRYGASGTNSMWRYFTVRSQSNGMQFVPFIGIVTAGVTQDTRITDIVFDSRERYFNVQTSNDSHFNLAIIGAFGEIGRLATDEKPKRVQAEMQHIGRPFDKKVARKMAVNR